MTSNIDLEPYLLDVSELVFKGAFDYTVSSRHYTEEEFEILKNQKTGLLTYKVQMNSRLETGEFMRINIIYQLNKEFFPVYVRVVRTLGKIVVKEIFVLSKRGDNLCYEFQSDTVHEINNFIPPNKFQIATPATCHAFCFIGSKKYDPTGKNYYNIISSENIWRYNGEPEAKDLLLVKRGNAQEIIMIKGKELKATGYNIFTSNEMSQSDELPLRVYISKHYHVPYQIISPDRDIKVVIRYFNEVERANYDEAY